LHVLFCAVHVVDITGRCTATVPGEVARFSTVEAGSFRSRVARFFLELCGLCSCCVCVCVISLVLASVVGCSSARQVHRNLYIVVCRSWGIGRVVGGSLLLLLLLPLCLILLRASSPGLWLELSSVLSEGVVEGPRVWKSSSSSDEFYHLPALHDLDSLGLILVICHGEWGLYNLI
jgi:hypothetical protein